MYNYLVKEMFRNYEAVTDDNITNFLSDGCLVGTLYRKEKVLNIFLAAKESVIFNHHGLAIFVVAKNYKVLNNSRVSTTEAAWLIGCCGAEWEKTLVDPMYLGNGIFFGNMKVSPITRVYPVKNYVTFKLFNFDIKWYRKKQPYSHIYNLDPALIYPVKPSRKKVKNARAFLRKEHDWEYNAGYGTAGSPETRYFIDNIANKRNHTDFSIIEYTKMIQLLSSKDDQIKQRKYPEVAL